MVVTGEGDRAPRFASGFSVLDMVEQHTLGARPSSTFLEECSQQQLDPAVPDLISSSPAPVPVPTAIAFPANISLLIVSQSQWVGHACAMSSPLWL